MIADVMLVDWCTFISQFYNNSCVKFFWAPTGLKHGRPRLYFAHKKTYNIYYHQGDISAARTLENN